jgi:hypothetical protein
MWYVHSDTNDDGVVDSLDGYRKATALERTFASVEMTAILNGEFNVEEELENITIGEFMSHEKCTHDENCFVHPDGVHVADVIWYDEQEDGTYVPVTDNLTLAIADFTIKQMQDPTFADQLLTKVKAKVTIGDVFGDTEGTPLALLDENTKIGDINGALTEAFETSTAGEMYDAKILPFNDATIAKMDTSYGTLVLADRVDAAYDAKAQSAIDANAHLACSPADAGYLAYTNAVGRTFWMSLTANELLDILVSAI